MRASPEQRVEARRKALCIAGYSDVDAVRMAHEVEGVPLPASAAPTEAVDHDQVIEDLHWRHTCELRRADAATMRAAKLIREVRLLRSVLEAVDAEAGRIADRIGAARVPLSIRLAHARDRLAVDVATAAKRAQRRRDRA